MERAQTIINVATEKSITSNLLVGAVGGLVGYFIGNSIVYQAAYVPTSKDNFFEDYKDFIQGTAGNVVNNVFGFLLGDWQWYLFAAGIGAVNDLVAAKLTDTTVFPIAFAAVGGFGLAAFNSSVVNPPAYPRGVDPEACADGDARGCTIYKDGKRDGWASAGESAKQNWQYWAMGPFGIAYWGYKSLS